MVNGYACVCNVWTQYVSIFMHLIKKIIIVCTISDKNECDLGVCSGGTCINNEGGFLCECPEDYKLSIDGTYCIGKHSAFFV